MEPFDDPESLSEPPADLPSKLELMAHEAMAFGYVEWAMVMYWAAHELRRLRDALGPREVQRD